MELHFIHRHERTFSARRNTCWVLCGLAFAASVAGQPVLTPPNKLTPAANQQEPLSAQMLILVKRIRFSGNTVVPDSVLEAISTPYQGRHITSQELQDLRRIITQHYIHEGFINSGAVIPDQKVKDGNLEIKIIEGTLNDIEVSGNNWLNSSYISSRLRLDNKEILNIKELQQNIQILQQNRRIRRLNAKLSPGISRGEAKLAVDVEEERLYDFGVSFNNWRSPSIGGMQLSLYGALYNILGFGSTLRGNFNLTDEFDDGYGQLTIPLTSRDTLFNVYYDRNSTNVSEAFFRVLDISSATDTIGVSISHPFYRTPDTEFTADVIFEKRRSKTFLFGRPFSFAPGPQNGISKVTVLRLGQQWTNRSTEQVLAFRSLFSIGLDALDSTINPGDLPDSRFFAWRGQFQWLRRMDDNGTQLLFRTEVQLAANSLLPMEKFAVGGATTVRGYRQNLLVRDNGVVASVELRVPVFRLPIPYLSEGLEDGTVQLATFFDFGWSHNTDLVTLEPTTIASPGVGIRWDPHPKLHSELYWGIPLRKINVGGTYDLQDSGIHFLIDLRLL